MIRLRYAAIGALVGTAAIASAYHEGDMIYGIVGGQILVVDPTDALINPPRKLMNYVPPDQGLPAFYSKDQGWDYWDIPGYGIEFVGEAKLVCSYIDPRLRCLSGGLSYFSLGADFDSFLLKGTRRHKHFAFETSVLKRGMKYAFRFQLVEAKDVNGNSVADSPIYTIFYETPPLLKVNNGIKKDPISLFGSTGFIWL